jgi:hypothetical protein
MDCTWEEAQEKCIQKGGYLVQINSPEEFDYITQLIEDQEKENIQFFIGGRRNVWDVDYYWVDEYGNLTGDSLNDSLAWCSSYWLDGEPSLEDQDMDETCMTMFYSSGEGRWVWNDVPSDILAAVPGYAGKIGFICEYDTE